MFSLILEAVAKNPIPRSLRLNREHSAGSHKTYTDDKDYYPGQPAATVTADKDGTFTLITGSLSGNSFNPKLTSFTVSHRQRSTIYKTEAAALRAAAKWIEGEVERAKKWQREQAESLSVEEARKPNRTMRDQTRRSSPAIDKSEYPEIRGMEGPFRYRDGRILYYDPKKGRYYDRKTDIYLDRDDIPEAVEDDDLEEAAKGGILPVKSRDPLTPEETEALKAANIFLMDVELGEYNVRFTKEVQKVWDLKRRPRPEEARILIDFFRKHAPANFS